MSDDQDGIRAGSVHKVKMFTGKDFHLWRFQFMTYAENREVDGFLDGSEKKPEEDASVDEKKRWKKGDSTARTILLTAIDYNQMQLVTTCNTAQEMWEKLRGKYEKESLSHRSKLNREFHNIRKGDRSLESYIKDFDAICDKMRGAGITVPNDEKVIQLTEGLPEDAYDVIVTSILEVAGIEYEEACGRLLTYEGRHTKRDSHQDGEVFFGGRGRGSSRGGGRGNSRGRGRGGGPSNGKGCYRCGEQGHFASDCKKPPKCYGCLETGHISTNCPNKGKAQEEVKNKGNGSVFSLEEVKKNVVGEANMAGRVPPRMTWIIDSGCTQHMCNSEKYFLEPNELQEKKHMMMGNGDLLEIEKEGDVGLKVMSAQGMVDGTLKDVLYSAEVRRNLVSVVRMMRKGINVVFAEDTMTCSMVRGKVWFDPKDVVGSAPEKDDLFVLEEGGVTKTEMGEMYASVALSEERLWHLRLGHLGSENLRKLQSKEMVNGLEIKGNLTGNSKICEGCMKGRQSREQFPLAEHRGRDLLELVHSDVCGPITPSSIGGNRFYVTFVDDFSRKTWVYLLKHKSEVFGYFKTWKWKVEKQSGKKMKCLRTDRGGEYLSAEYKAFLEKEGIDHQVTMAGTPQQNGVAERMNRTLQEKGRSMLAGSGLKGGFWGEAIMTAAYLRNRSPSRSLEQEKTPEEIFSGWKPSVRHLRVFGCKSYVWVPDEKRRKMEEKSWTGILVGYAHQSKGYRIYNPVTRRIETSRDVRFSEEEFVYPQEIGQKHFGEEGSSEMSQELTVRSESTVTTEPQIREESTEVHREENRTDDRGMSREEIRTITGDRQTELQGVTENPGEEQTEVAAGARRRSTRVTWAPVRLTAEKRGELRSEEQETETETQRRPIREVKQPVRLTADRRGELHSIVGYCGLAVGEEPPTMREALQSEDRELWEKALINEHSAIIKNNTYSLVQRPRGQRVLRSKYVLKVKRRQDGRIDKYKARLVILGNMQEGGVDYEETFAPVMKYQSLRTVLAIANEEGLLVHQMDVKNAFLHGELEEDVFMEQPEFLVKKGEEEKVWKLNKALYGLKQAPRAWNKRLDDFLKGKGFYQCLNDTAIYTKGEGDDKVILAVYVDDILLISKKICGVNEVKGDLSREFEMVDFEEVESILGIQITRSMEEGWLELDQKRYVEVILSKFHMSDCKGVTIPLEGGLKYTKEQEAITEEERREMESIPFRQAIGSLMYLMVCTRPDLAASIGVFSKFMQNPGIQHWEGIKRIFRYLKMTAGKCLRFEKQGRVEVKGYCDADWAGDIDTMKSTSGYVFMIGGGAISWSSKKQQTVALSSSEAEYMSATHASKEALWVKRFVEEIGWKQPCVEIYCDNQSALKLMKNPKYHAKTKHISVQYHFLRELIEEGEIKFIFVGTNLQCADFLTKGLAREKLERFTKDVGLKESTKKKEEKN